MTSFNNNHRRVLHAGVAGTLFLTALAGCQSAVTSPLAGTPVAPDAALHEYSLEATSAAALKLVASAGSSYTGTTPAGAVDGNTNTSWASGNVANPWLIVDLGASATLASVGIKLTPGPSYALDTSLDRVAWTTRVASNTNTTWNVESKKLPAGTVGRYVRLRFSGTLNAQVFEVQPVVSPTVTPTAAPTKAPSVAPTVAPTATPTKAPSVAPTVAPTSTPTKAPSAAPTVAPTSGPTAAPTPSGGGTGIAINVNTADILHAADSHILGTVRNHVTGQFPNGPAKLAAMKQLQPTWGAKKYLYRIGHGITDGRVDYSYMTGFHFEQVWDTTKTYPYDDIRDALGEANTMGADEMHVINFGTGDPAEAGRFVSFLNHAGDANRAAHPIAQQNAQLFELGNEISWTSERGHTQYAPDETTYAKRAKLFAQSMRANSDIPIKIGAVAGTNSNWMGNGWSGGATSVKNILTTMGSDVDFLIYHGYPSWPMNVSGNLLTYMAQNEWNKQKLESEIKPAIKQYAGGRDVYIANTEFFSNLYSDVPHARGMFGAMYSADSIVLAFNEDIRTCVQFCMDHGALADASFFIGDDATNTTPVFKLQQMVAQHWGDNIVSTAGQNIPTVSVTGAAATIAMPKLSFSAATSGNKTYVMVLNRTNDSDVTSAVNLGFTPSSVTAYTLGGSSGWDSTTASVTTSTSAKLSGMNFAHATFTILEITK